MICKRTACAIAVTVALGMFSACSDTKSSGPGDTGAPTDSASSSTDLSTTVAPTTIETTIAPTTTIAARPYLRSDGLGAFDFGASYADVLAGMGLTVISDEGQSYADLGDGTLLSADGSYSFTYASSRTVCWDDEVANHLCAYFGAADDASVTLVGWEYFTVAGMAPAVGTLFSASGATINVAVSAVPAMPAVEGECYGYTNVVLDGILLDLLADGGATFGTYADDGTYTLLVPAPAATVTFLQTGERPQPYGDGEGDC